MAIVETISNRFSPVLTRARGFLRELIRDYSDKELQDHMAAAAGRITDAHRASYKDTQLARAFNPDHGLYRMIHYEPGIPAGIQGDTEALHTELKRLKSLTPSQLDLEVQQASKAWLTNHRFPIFHS